MARKKRPQDIDLDFVAEALPHFVSEAEEQLASFEQLLLELEERPQDAELLGGLFRCAHTVKGSAGLFGLDGVVEFTHHVETLLDRLREGELQLDPGLGSLLLASKDEVQALISHAAAHPADPEALSGRSSPVDGQARRAALVTQLHAALGRRADSAGKADAPADAAPAAPSPGWHVAVQFGREIFRNGMDPLTLLRYVAGLGEMTGLRCHRDAVPPLEDLDPESCHLAFDFDLGGEASREEVEKSFAFVREDCSLRIDAQGATPDDLARRIEALPDQARLGDLLLSAGAASPAQIAAALQAQQLALQHGTAAGAAGAEVPRLGELLTTQAGVPAQVVDAALRKQQRQREAGKPAAAAGEDQRFIRVQADRLDAVINLLGELVVAGAGAAMLARQTRQGRLLEANLHVGRLVEEIRNSTLQLRMVPIGETFARFRRVVRDTAAQLGKAVALEIDGGETELDKSMVERIADPLMHLVRNGLDHGLETPEQRLAAGKPAEGRLRLWARHESGAVLIGIEDDGRGIDRQRVLARAWERGLVEPGVVPPDGRILELIFEPGFSTAAAVTELSGRGVGMDVVKRNIEALRGHVQVQSEAGQGTRITIRLPLTLAIIDGFLVGVAGSKFILPLESVVEVVSSQADDPPPDEHGRYCTRLRGEVLPVVCLRTLYELEAPPPEFTSIVVLRGDSGRYGLAVDLLLGQHQTVIKPLGPLFRKLRGISGSTILGNGEVALILDGAALGQLAEEPPARTPRGPRPAGGAPPGAAPHGSAPPTATPDDFTTSPATSAIPTEGQAS